MFIPKEIIFAGNSSCNLLCPHCFVNRSPEKLDIEKARKFIESAVLSPVSRIEKIGFTGGEPFLYMEFLTEIIKFTIEKDLMFDQIMTNGDWWKDENDLNSKLQQIYDAGYDGKIGLSWDIFHNQNAERIKFFIQAVENIFGEGNITIQTVVPYGSSKKEMIKEGKFIVQEEFINKGDRANCSNSRDRVIRQYFLPQTFPSYDKRAWSGKKWFKDDYCEGPGQILFVHSSGNIAPCCGFANENPEIFIGTIDDGFETVIEKAASNRMINICYQEGLGIYRKKLEKELKKNKNKYPGKCTDICSFCDYVMNCKV